MGRLGAYRKYSNRMARIENLHNPKFNKPDIHLEVTQNSVLMKFLLDNVKGKNRDNFKTLLNDGQVFVDGEVITWYNHPLVAGQKVKITWEKAIRTHYPGIRIIFEDEHLIVIEKDA